MSKQEEIESLQVSDLDAKTRRKLSSLATEYLRLGREIDTLTAPLAESRKILKDAIEELILPLRPDDKLRVLGADWRANKTRNSSTKLNPNKLAEAGVDPGVILSATETTYGNWYVKIEAVEDKSKKD